MVIIEQFNPVTKNWNVIYEVPDDEFDPTKPAKIDKYGGPYRYRKDGKAYPMTEFIEEPVEDPVEFVQWFDDDDGEWE